MNRHLEFENPIYELESKISELSNVSDRNLVNLQEDIERLRKRSTDLTKTIFSNLDAWQITQVSRHPERPHTSDYLKRIVTDFEELHGDRCYGDDPSIICGIGRIDDLSVALIGHQKGRDTKQKIFRNFGMPRPEGYRKAKRIMRMAEHFHLPIVTFIDTPGAYPGVDAETHGQSNAIAENLLLMAQLRTPIIATIIGEGGSGGALAIGVADKVFMLQYATYSVISPEGCASILWKTAKKASHAANVLGLTADRLQNLGVIEDIIEEPLGGAHRDYDTTADNVKRKIIHALRPLIPEPKDQLIKKRAERFLKMGFFDKK